MDCPNDRYVNDEAICQAVTAMLARVGVKINLNAQPKSKYFAKVLQAGGIRHVVLPARLDAGLVRQLERARQHVSLPRRKGQVGGNINLGGYCNPKVEELTNKILVESDKAKRDEMIKEAYQTRAGTGLSAIIPLHQQALAWGVSKKVK